MKFFKFLLAALSIVVVSSCASLTGFQDGRSLGEEAFEMTGSLNLSQSPDFFFDDEEVLDNFFFPNIEIAGKYGATDKLDVGVKLNTNLNFSLTSKYQVLGDRQSNTALGIGADVGTFGLISSLWNVQVPLYFSVHPTEKFTWYLTPRYIFQFGVADLANSIHYYGGNVGVLLGRKNKFGFDLGYYQLSNFSSFPVDLLTIGIGGRFVFGGKEEETMKDDVMKKKPRRRK